MREEWGGSLYVPQPGCQMMQVGAESLDEGLKQRAEQREPVTGVEYMCVRGVKGLREAGVLAGVRAMMARVYGSEKWYVEDDGRPERVECLYESRKREKHEVLFIVARMIGDDRWAWQRAGRGTSTSEDDTRRADLDRGGGGLTTQRTGEHIAQAQGGRQVQTGIGTGERTDKQIGTHAIRQEEVQADTQAGRHIGEGSEEGWEGGRIHSGGDEQEGRQRRTDEPQVVLQAERQAGDAELSASGAARGQGGGGEGGERDEEGMTSGSTHPEEDAEDARGTRGGGKRKRGQGEEGSGGGRGVKRSKGEEKRKGRKRGRGDG